MVLINPDWNLIRVNQSYSERLRNLVLSQFENSLYLLQWKKVQNLSDLIRFNRKFKSGRIWNNPKQFLNSNQPERKLIYLGWKLGLNWSILRFNSSESELFLNDSEISFRNNLKQFVSQLMKNGKKSIRLKLIQSES